MVDLAHDFGENAEISVAYILQCQGYVRRSRAELRKGAPASPLDKAEEVQKMLTTAKNQKILVDYNCAIGLGLRARNSAEIDKGVDRHCARVSVHYTRVIEALEGLHTTYGDLAFPNIQRRAARLSR